MALSLNALNGELTICAPIFSLLCPRLEPLQPDYKQVCTNEVKVFRQEYLLHVM